MQPVLLFVCSLCVEGRIVPNVKSTSLTPSIEGGAELRPDWTLLTREILKLPSEESKDVCLKPDSDELADWGSAIASAETEFKLKQRLEPFFEKLRSQTHDDWQNPDQILTRLEHCAHILQRACTSHLQEGPDLRPKWSTQPDTLKAQAVKFIYDNLFQQFDQDGFAELTGHIMKDSAQMRFAQSLQTVQSSMPHCDLGGATTLVGNSGTAGGAPFPGGPFRLNFGFNLSKMLADQLMAAGESGSSGSSAISSMMKMTAIMSVISIVESR